MIERKTRKARRIDKLKRVWIERRNVILWRILSVCSPQGENERKGSVAGQFSQCPVYTACAFQLEFCKINVMQWIDFKAEKEYNEVEKTRNKKIGRRV